MALEIRWHTCAFEHVPRHLGNLRMDWGQPSVQIHFFPLLVRDHCHYGASHCGRSARLETCRYAGWGCGLSTGTWWLDLVNAYVCVFLYINMSTYTDKCVQIRINDVIFLFNVLQTWGKRAYSASTKCWPWRGTSTAWPWRSFAITEVAMNAYGTRHNQSIMT